MKAVLSYVCVLIGIAVIMVASCGPQRKFCPGTMDNNCVIELDSGLLEEDSGTSACSPGYRFVIVNTVPMCVPIDGGT